MTKHYCDRCGKDITDHRDHYTATVTLSHPKADPRRLNFQYAQLDLCLTCSREIAKWATTKTNRAVAA